MKTNDISIDDIIHKLEELKMIAQDRQNKTTNERYKELTKEQQRQAVDSYLTR